MTFNVVEVNVDEIHNLKETFIEDDSLLSTFGRVKSQ